MAEHKQQSNNAQQDAERIVLVDHDTVKSADLEGSALEIGAFNAVKLVAKLSTDAPCEVVLQTSKMAQPGTWRDVGKFEFDRAARDSKEQTFTGLDAYIRVFAKPREAAEYTLRVEGELFVAPPAPAASVLAYDERPKGRG
jgi:hypothetical protein